MIEDRLHRFEILEIHKILTIEKNKNEKEI
jgi:hypothetical protein